MPEYEDLCKVTLLDRLIRQLHQNGTLTEYEVAELQYPSYDYVKDIYNEEHHSR